MVQIVEYFNPGVDRYTEAKHIIGKGQRAGTIGRKIFRCFQPVRKEGQKAEFEASMIQHVAGKIKKWNERDPSNYKTVTFTEKRGLEFG